MNITIWVDTSLCLCKSRNALTECFHLSPRKIPLLIMGGGGEGILPMSDFCTLCKVPPLHTLHYNLALQLFVYGCSFSVAF